MRSGKMEYLACHENRSHPCWAVVNPGNALVYKTAETKKEADELRPVHSGYITTPVRIVPDYSSLDCGKCPYSGECPRVHAPVPVKLSILCADAAPEWKWRSESGRAFGERGPWTIAVTRRSAFRTRIKAIFSAAPVKTSRTFSTP